MNMLKLSWKYLWSKPLNLLLNTLLFGLGVGIIVFLMIAQKQLAGNLTSSSKGIDLVVGAKGSPMQLILSSIYQVDYPTGNVSLIEAEKLTKNRFVKRAVPLALGDAYNGVRIVGTTSEYLQLYNAEVSEGKVWSVEMEVCLGSVAAEKLGMKVGDEFVGQHGLAEGGYDHDEHGKFQVVGILAETGAVIDQLILTNVEAVWAVHQEEHNEEEVSVDSAIFLRSKLIPNVNLNSEDSTREVTSLLIQYRSPMGAMQLPRYINQKTNMQAASPAFEMARLLTLVGVGIDVFEGFAFIILAVALLSVLMAIYNALKDRKYDLAVMRALGASKSLLFRSIISEGMMIALLGTFLGLAFGHGMIAGVASIMENTSSFSGATFYEEEAFVILLGVAAGAIVAVIPAIGLYRVDVSRTLTDE